MASSRCVLDGVKYALESNNNSELAKLYQILKKKVLMREEVTHQSLLDRKLHQYTLGVLDINASVNKRLNSLQERLVAFRYVQTSYVYVYITGLCN